MGQLQCFIKQYMNIHYINIYCTSHTYIYIYCVYIYILYTHCTLNIVPWPGSSSRKLGLAGALQTFFGFPPSRRGGTYEQCSRPATSFHFPRCLVGIHRMDDQKKSCLANSVIPLMIIPK
jgi:hypothetical protein